MQMVICKIKDRLKPLVSFLIPGGNRRCWVGDSRNGQVLGDISKYQVHTGLGTGSTFETQNLLLECCSVNKQTHKLVHLYEMTGFEIDKVQPNAISSHPLNTLPYHIQIQDMAPPSVYIGTETHI